LWATIELNSVTLAQKRSLLVKFDNARGLRTGEPVFVLGTQMGKVVDVKIQPPSEKYRVLVEIEIEGDVGLKRDIRVEIVDSSFLGGKKVNIYPGVGQIDLAEGVSVDGTASRGPLELLGDMFSGERNKENLENILSGLRRFVDDLNKADGSLRRFMDKPKIYDDAEALVASIRKSAEELEKKESLLGRLIYDSELGTKTGNIVADVEKVTAKLSSTEGTLGKLINDTVFANKFDKIVHDLQLVTDRLTKTESTLGRLINDPKLGERVDRIVDDVAKVTENLNNKDSGLLGALIKDEILLANARKIFDDVAQVTDDINSGKGVLGRLIKDEDMGRRLDSLIRQITRAIEDAREAAPIGTFFQVFSGAF
jgi:ABC-type transporter Mla subunit MlaD